MICVAFFFQILPNLLPVSPQLELLDYSSYKVKSSHHGAVGSASAWETRGSNPG